MEIDNKLSRLFSKKKKDPKSLDRKLATSCQQFFTQLIEFRPASRTDSHLENLKAKYKPLNKVILTPADITMETEPSSNSTKSSPEPQSSDAMPTPRKVLYNGDDLQMGWKRVRSIGAGLSNMGNTCFLNSVLQCLAYTPPLVNYLLSGDHKQSCGVSGFCALCEFQKHCGQVLTATHSCVKPISIAHQIRAIAKHFRLGRQEDAHEFLRYFIDGMQRSCLHGYPAKLDPHSKATTVVHQIFGGYHRSQVKCLECQRTSNTYDPLLDVSLDIKNCSSLTKALNRSIKADLLEGDNSYACPYCKKMTKAQKRFTIQELPRVLTLQLKRFDFNSMFGGKINKSVSYSEHLNMRPFMSNTQGPSEWYRLYAVLVHYGFSSHSGHYYCYVRNSNNSWYCMNDSQVSQASLATVLSQEAYLLFYIRDKNYSPPTMGPAKPSGPLAKKLCIPAGVRNDPSFLTTPKKVGLDKSNIPPAQRKPTGVVPPSPKITPVSSTNKEKHSTNGKFTQEFSIPIQKTIVTIATNKTTNKTTTTPPPTVEATKKHAFVPRQVKPFKKSPKPKSKDKLVVRPSLSPVHEVNENSNEKILEQDIPLASPIQTSAVNVSSNKGAAEQTILDYAKPLPTEQSSKFIGPLPPSETPKADEDVPPPPLVALVSPQSHTSSILGSSSKPVALVRPSPHIEESKAERKSEKLTTQLVVMSKGTATPNVTPSPKRKNLSTTKHAVTPPPRHAPTPPETILISKHTPTPPEHIHTPSQSSLQHTSTSPTSSPQVDSTTSGDVPTSPKPIPYGPELSSDHVTSTLEQDVPLLKSRKNKKKKYRKRSSTEIDSDSGRVSNDEDSSDKVTSTEKGEKTVAAENQNSSCKNKNSHIQDKTPSRDREHKSHHHKHSDTVSSTRSRDEGEDRHRKRSRSQSRSRSPRSRPRIGRHSHRSSYTAPVYHPRHHSYRNFERVSKHHRNRLHSCNPSNERVKKHDSSGERVRRRDFREERIKSSDSVHDRVKERHDSVEEEHRLKKKRRNHHSEEKGQSPPPTSKRHKSESSGEGNKKVPEVSWDSKKSQPIKWDGSRQSDVLEQLTSQDREIKSWDGGENSLGCGPSTGRRGHEDSWDEELDRGKVKKVKSRRASAGDFGSSNRFQEIHNRRSSGSYHHRSHKHHQPHKHHKWHGRR